MGSDSTKVSRALILDQSEGGHAPLALTPTTSSMASRSADLASPRARAMRHARGRSPVPTLKPRLSSKARGRRKPRQSSSSARSLGRATPRARTMGQAASPAHQPWPGTITPRSSGWPHDACQAPFWIWSLGRQESQSEQESQPGVPDQILDTRSVENGLRGQPGG